MCLCLIKGVIFIIIETISKRSVIYINHHHSLRGLCHCKNTKPIVLSIITSKFLILVLQNRSELWFGCLVQIQTRVNWIYSFEHLMQKYTTVQKCTKIYGNFVMIR